MKKLLTLFVALAFLAGCSVSSLPPDHTDPAIREENPGEDINSIEYDKLRETAAEHGYPFLLDECSVDLNGDQLVDEVKLLQEWYPIFNEMGTPSFEKGLLHYATLQLRINNDVYSYTFDDTSYNSNLSVMQSSEGESICVVTFI